MRDQDRPAQDSGRPKITRQRRALLNHRFDDATRNAEHARQRLNVARDTLKLAIAESAEATRTLRAARLELEAASPGMKPPTE